MEPMTHEQCEKFMLEKGLDLNWTYRDWPDVTIPIDEFYLNRKKSVYEKLLYCPNFVRYKTRDRHGIIIHGWFDTQKPLVGRIDYKKPLDVINYTDKEKFLNYACEIYLKEGYNVEFITFDDDVTNELLNRLKQISN